MPPLPDQDPPITRYPSSPRARPSHPSPTVDGLRLEAMSARELAWWGHRFGVDVPYLMTPSGFGEWLPLVGS